MGTESESMLQLAAEAFQSKNFDLAADIYECQLAGLGDPGSRLELMVKRADALAFGGKFTEAFGIYRQASEIERLRPGHLENLLEYLANSIRRQDGGDGPNSSRTRPPEEAGALVSTCFGVATGCGYDAFSCRMCLGFMFEPVTLPCGHCFCKKCLERERERPISCKECKDNSRLADVQSYRVNVVLSNLLAKCFPCQTQAGRLRREGNLLYAEKRMEAALEKYNQAILIAPRDHILFSNRSQIHSSLKHYQKALRDAETACRLMPHWSKLLSDLLAPVTDQVPERVLDYISVLSSRVYIKNSLTHSDAHVHMASAAHTPSLSTSAPSKASQTLIQLSTQSPTALDYPQPPCVRSEHSELKGQGEVEGRRLDRGLLLKRKRRRAEEEEEEEGSEEGSEKCKKSKSEPTEVTAAFVDVFEATDLECSLCMRLFYEPVTTPCGHTFCLQCLERCLDHNPKCPLCKEGLSEYLAQRRYCKTAVMEKLISTYLPAELMERQKTNQEEMAELSNLNKNVPIFVCTMAFPTVPCPLHIFEPCYRLMIRRCMETGTNCFGMCLGDNLKGFADYGCLLEIRNVEFFSDGRSVVDTVGKRRFKVIQHSERDGYNTADIEYLEDVKVEGVAERELQSLHDEVYDQALVWVNSLKAEQKERIVGHFGPMPEKDSEPQASPNGPSWCWWLLAVLPLEGRAQLPFLALTSLKDRLSGIRRVLLFMAHTRHR
ncbi:LON peptidase N-terminal domain and RING finger protein 3-like isoform X2 [Myripristis murdjan]|uniref:LON peptidase N-terminal domain and RING finger protein 3-like isoform X2 n=1 Tax=Myripristis murdjan TaxID=586833 RepID=UPI001175D753|nr:LON peptidase N-terminal domain and RING finger protein 3-like isoform X2 [Myripristis murdjan]